jgi:hypothetical protein
VVVPVSVVTLETITSIESVITISIVVNMVITTDTDANFSRFVTVVSWSCKLVLALARAVILGSESPVVSWSLCYNSNHGSDVKHRNYENTVIHTFKQVRETVIYLTTTVNYSGFSGIHAYQVLYCSYGGNHGYHKNNLRGL